VGYYYRPENDFVVQEPGVYTVDLKVTYDGRTSAGQVTPPFPTGDILGTREGRFSVYVVPRVSPLLAVDQPRSTFLTPPAEFSVTATLPGAFGEGQGHVTGMMPGFLLETRSLAGTEGRFSYTYDPAALAREGFPLDVLKGNTPQAVDLVTITLFASGTSAEGRPIFGARVLALHGQELLDLAPAPVPSPPDGPR
jgi:hypothetical protein